MASAGASARNSPNALMVAHTTLTVTDGQARAGSPAATSATAPREVHRVVAGAGVAEPAQRDAGEARQHERTAHESDQRHHHRTQVYGRNVRQHH